MNDFTETLSIEIDENCKINLIEDHTMSLKVCLNNLTTNFRYGSELSPLKNDSYKSFSNSFKKPSEQFTKKNKDQSLENISSLSRISETNSEVQNTKEYKTQKETTKCNIPKSNTGYSYKALTVKFDQNFHKQVKNLSIFEDITKDNLIEILFSLHFLSEKSENSETTELYNLLSKCPTQSYLKSLLQAILRIKDESNLLTQNDLLQIKKKFYGLYSNYFKAKKKNFKVDQPSFSPNTSFTLKSPYRQLSNQAERFESQGDYLLSYQKSFKENKQKQTEKFNKERFQECTFKPKIDKKSKKIDSSPSVLRIKNCSSYKSLKDCKQKSHRSETLYEFGEISRNLKIVNKS